MSKVEDLQVANTVFINKTELQYLRFKSDFLDFLCDEIDYELLSEIKVKFIEGLKTD